MTMTMNMFQKKRPDRRAFAIEQGPHTYVGEPLQLSVANDNNNDNNNNDPQQRRRCVWGEGKFPPSPLLLPPSPPSPSSSRDYC